MKTVFLKVAILIATTMILGQPAQAEDWTINATESSCLVNTGTFTNLNGGLKLTSTGGTVICNLTKKVQDNTFDTVWVRVDGTSSGDDITCILSSISPWGGVEHTYTTSSSSGTHSIAMNLPTVVNFSGYENVTCVLSKDQTLFGIRYIQK